MRRAHRRPPILWLCVLRNAFRGAWWCSANSRSEVDVFELVVRVPGSRQVLGKFLTSFGHWVLLGKFGDLQIYVFSCELHCLHYGCRCLSHWMVAHFYYFLDQGPFGWQGLGRFFNLWGRPNIIRRCYDEGAGQPGIGTSTQCLSIAANQQRPKKTYQNPSKMVPKSSKTLQK